MIVAIGNQWAARKQRQADSERLDRQLAHDRDQREAENRAAGDRLESQLKHDRRVRDLDHVRAALGPIVSQVLEWDPLVTLIVQVNMSSDTTSTEQRDAIRPLNRKLLAAATKLRLDGFALGMTVGMASAIVLSIEDLASPMRAAGKATREWLDGLLSYEELKDRLTALDKEHTQAVTKFQKAAEQLVGWEGLSGLAPEDLRPLHD